MAFKSINPEFPEVHLRTDHLATITNIFGRAPTDEELFIAQVEGVFLIGLEKRASGTHQIEQIYDPKLVWTAQTAMTPSEQAFEKTAMQTEQQNEWIKNHTPRGFTHLRPPNNYGQLNIQEGKRDKEIQLITEDLEFELSTQSAEKYNLPILSTSALDDFAQYLRLTVTHSETFPENYVNIIEHIIYFKEFKLFCTMTRPQYIEIVRTAINEYGNWPGNLNIYFVTSVMYDKMRINPVNDADKQYIIQKLPKGLELVGNYIVRKEDCYAAIPSGIWSWYLLPEFAGFIPLLPTAVDMQKITDMEDDIDKRTYRSNYQLFPVITRFTIDKIIQYLPPNHGELTRDYHKRLYAYDGFVHYGTIKRYVLSNIKSVRVRSSGKYERYEYEDRPPTQWDDVAGTV